MIKKALIAAAALVALSAHAGYAQLQTPAGFGGTPGNWTYAAAANDNVYGKVVHQAGALTANVGGQAVKMPAAYRLAANAPRIAAGAIFLNPYVRTGVAIATWLGVAGLVYHSASGLWKKSASPGEYPVSTGLEYMDRSEQWVTDWDAACKSFRSDYFAWAGHPGQCSWPGGGIAQGLQTRESKCPANWYHTPAGCVINPPPRDVTKPEFEDLLAPKPMPDRVPQELPYPTPLPVEQPFINPDPGENPSNKPLRIPTGNPVPVPNTDPQQWRQPYIDIIPAPTPDKPWQVDVKPGEVTSTDPNPVQNPKPDAQEKPTEEQDKSLCEKHPEIAACEKVEVTDKPLPEQPKLYEPKYPDGITGVWNSKLQEIKATPLFNLAPSLLPNVSAGSCPSWKIDLSIDGWTNAGVQDVSPPCWVWDVAKLVIIASALLLARRLIFGG